MMWKLSLIVLGFVAMCSVTSAQASRTNEYSTSTKAQVTQTTDNDLSEFWSRLANRLGWVFNEVVALVKNWVVKQDGDHNSPESSAGVQTNAEVPQTSEANSSFSDVQTIPERYFVDTLASHAIVNGSNGKFFPDNYTRLGDFIKIVVDTYRVQVGFDTATDAGLTNKSYFMAWVIPGSLWKAINTAYELGFLDNVLTASETKKQDFDLFLTTKIIDQVFTNIQEGFPGLIAKPKMGISDLYVKRGVMAKYLVQGFDLAPKGNDGITFHPTPKNYFTDINGNPYGDAIKTLADLDIVNSQSKKFYPDNYLRNYEFVVMLVNAQKASDGKQIDLDSYTNQYLSNPNKQINKLAVYHSLEDITGIQINYDETNAGQTKMTRGEFASILVNVYQLDKPAFNLDKVPDNNTGAVDNTSLLLQIKTLLSML